MKTEPGNTAPIEIEDFSDRAGALRAQFEFRAALLGIDSLFQWCEGATGRFHTATGDQIFAQLTQEALLADLREYSERRLGVCAAETLAAGQRK